jgi:hypothetical protein
VIYQYHYYLKQNHSADECRRLSQSELVTELKQRGTYNPNLMAWDQNGVIRFLDRSVDQYEVCFEIYVILSSDRSPAMIYSANYESDKTATRWCDEISTHLSAFYTNLIFAVIYARLKSSLVSII